MDNMLSADPVIIAITGAAGDLTRVFTELQICRIDHYLGKRTVQNILACRSTNALLEPISERQSRTKLGQGPSTGKEATVAVAFAT